jgi:glycosyltransferase involved in cell wall biosynthesis
VTFSVVIATRNRAALLDGALTSLRAQSDAPAFEIVVADNGSSDATAEVARAHDTRYVYVAEPNRGKARNAGIAHAQGDHVLFVDDDVVLPPTFLAAHARAHAAGDGSRAVSGPIVNVPSADDRPTPSAANFSRAFFVTCNASVPTEDLRAVGGFDESFDLYGWEDTDLGVRLRERGVRREFVWDAYLWHIKPPTNESLDEALGKALEKARMAARFVRKHPSGRVKLATGAYALNLLRARLFAPRFAQPLLAGLATSPTLPGPARMLAREALLDNVYTNELLAHLRD